MATQSAPKSRDYLVDANQAIPLPPPPGSLGMPGSVHQHPAAQPSSTYGPYGPPPRGNEPENQVPRTIADWQREERARQEQEWQNQQRQEQARQEEVPEEGSFTDGLFALFWPAVCWLTSIINLVMLVSVTVQMMGSYDAYKHAQAFAVSMMIFGVQALVYRWLLKAPPEAH